MRVAVVLPYLPVLDHRASPNTISGAVIALDVSLRMLANHPDVETLELYLAPRDMAMSAGFREVAESILEPTNFGRGKLEFLPALAIPELWADGRERVIHTDDVHLMIRDRHLRDRYAAAAMPIVCDTHCLGHATLTESLRQLCALPSAPGDRILAASTAAQAGFRNTLAEFDQPDALPVEAIARSIDDRSLAPPPDGFDVAAARRAFGLPEQGSIALFLGRMTPSTKGDLAQLIVHFAAAAGPSDHLALVGYQELPTYGEQLMRVASAEGVADRVHILPTVRSDRKCALYHAADFVVFPADSLNEVFGQVTLEAMACGLPVVGTDWDGLKDTIADGVTGYRVPTYVPPVPIRLEEMAYAFDVQTTMLLMAQTTVIDGAVMADRMRRLFRDAALRQQMGRAARQAFEAQFDPLRLYDLRIAQMRRALEDARGETAELRAARRARTERYGQRVPLRRQAESYGTATLVGPGVTFRTTARGESARHGHRDLALLGELAVSVPPVVLATLLDRAAKGLDHGELLALAEDLMVSGDFIALGVGVLAKNGLLERMGTSASA
ncbi:MAG: glycosyltransferase family 4 protein [Fimbriimonadaceae bacterium]|nr:glycosyltransferase family 4 protein [Fimbriimonadaceae bacterium]